MPPINQLISQSTFPTLHCSFLHKSSCALSLISSFIALLLKGCLGLLQLTLSDFQPFGFYGSLGHFSGFLLLFFFLIASIFDNFARNSRPFFLRVRDLAFFRLASRHLHARDFCLMMAAIFMRYTI